ncbi:expressed unknown protein [Seminavis robusta]|uniref:Sulfotransferase n=1 Tax=Seminavis robusta TaxID=568900 RepID=A0A9N8D721_9STRA|nr:expressed unknown protein [Seminavis robusta]|eukprot:Sro4_g003160.1 n/a (296) ;mRNA; f:62620-63507
MKIKRVGFGRDAKGKPRIKVPIPVALFFLGLLAMLATRVLFISDSTPSAGITTDGILFQTAPSSPGTSVKLKVPTPVLVPSLPKSGTTSIWKYFLCGLGKGQAAHQWGSIANGTAQVRLGKCFQANIKKHRPLLQGCGDSYKVWTDAGFLSPGSCFYPSIHGGLEALYESYPQATILNIVRNTDAWVNSTSEFNNLWTRWGEKCDKFPGPKATREDYTKFYDGHTEMIRQFAKEHPSMTYLEIPLESPDTGKMLEEATGVNQSCWLNSRTMKGRRARPYLKKLREMEKQWQVKAP